MPGLGQRHRESAQRPYAGHIPAIDHYRFGCRVALVRERIGEAPSANVKGVHLEKVSRHPSRHAAREGGCLGAQRHDGPGDAGGQAGTWYSLDGGPYTTGTSATVGNGAHTVALLLQGRCRQPRDGAHGGAHDRHPGAPDDGSHRNEGQGRQGSEVPLPRDLTPRVRVTIVITRKGHITKRIVVGSRATGTVLTFRWRCSLPRGQYGWTVTAVDQAGNKQSRVLSNRIIVT
jgi:hypothetical protein